MDAQIRLKAFEWLEKMVSIQGDVLERQYLERGFVFQGEKITLVGPRGIWKPKIMDLPISITTTTDSPYEDKQEGEHFLEYKYRGTDPYHSDNVGLRELMRREIPLIYFLSVLPGLYLVTLPVFIVDDDMANLSFRVVLDDAKFIGKNQVLDSAGESIRRSYLTSQVRNRLHQRKFREKVLRAYDTRCTMCRLAHRELLDGAHIIPDKEEAGLPIVQNGLSLCKIHHAAFDKNIIGISPDYEIHVRQDVLEEIDGPMLKHGIQSLNKRKIILPKNRKDWPDKERLDFRFQGQFRKSS